MGGVSITTCMYYDLYSQVAVASTPSSSTPSVSVPISQLAARPSLKHRLGLSLCFSHTHWAWLYPVAKAPRFPHLWCSTRLQQRQQYTLGSVSCLVFTPAHTLRTITTDPRNISPPHIHPSGLLAAISGLLICRTSQGCIPPLGRCRALTVSSRVSPL